jgi:hypothetical protein
MKQIFTLIVLTFLLNVNVAASGTSILIDFGTTTQLSTGNWNNVNDHQAASVTLIDDAGNQTGITLTVTDPFYNGYNTNGTTTPTGDATIFASTSTSDNFFCNGAVWGSTPANPVGIITLSGLNPNKIYSFVVFASRMSVTNIREAKYTFTGSNGSKSANLNASNNTSNVAVISEVLPTSQGVIEFKSEAGPNNDSVEKFYFLGAMKINVVDNTTAIDNVGDNSLPVHVYYQKSFVRINNEFTGHVAVYNISGRIISEGQSLFGHYQTMLDKGVYIVKTSKGNAKLIVN